MTKSSTAQVCVNIALTGGVLCSLVWGGMNAARLGQLEQPAVAATPVAHSVHVAEDVTPRTVIVTREVPVEKRVEVPVEVPVTVTETVEVEVPDPTAWQQGYDSAMADASEAGGNVDPANIMAALSTPCASEDSDNCYWRADIMGNGEGQSFVNVEGHVFPLGDIIASDPEYDAQWWLDGFESGCEAVATSELCAEKVEAVR